MPQHGAPCLIYETVHGSRAYGLATAESDEDIKGIIVGPKSWYFGPRDSPEQLHLSKDHVHYEVRKFIRLAAAANPTMLEILWIDSCHQRYIAPAGARLLDQRDLFLSQRVKDTFAGYALSQLKRIKSHQRWLLHPPKVEPTRQAFGLPERSTIPREQLGAVEAMRRDGRMEDSDLSPNFLLVLDRERKYRTARREWEQYHNWLANRNPARAVLEGRHGYDTKHAQHLVRLLRMGKEILTTGGVMVTRPDREELLDIRRGCWSYEELLERAEVFYHEVIAAAQHSTLPPEPDDVVIEALCVAIIEDVLRDKR